MKRSHVGPLPLISKCQINVRALDQFSGSTGKTSEGHTGLHHIEEIARLPSRRRSSPPVALSCIGHTVCTTTTTLASAIEDGRRLRNPNAIPVLTSRLLRLLSAARETACLHATSATT